MGDTTSTAAPARSWTRIGAVYTLMYRKAIEKQITELAWQSEKEAAMMPALGINECIKQLQLRKVSQFATNGYVEMVINGERGYYSIYGIECNYKNGRARIYVLDTGTGLTPLCSDFWPAG